MSGRRLAVTRQMTDATTSTEEKEKDGIWDDARSVTLALQRARQSVLMVQLMATTRQNRGKLVTVKT